MIMSVGALISQASLWAFILKEITFTKPRWLEMKKHIKPLIILFIPAIAISLYKYMDKIMIALLSNNTQLGFYENSEKAIGISTAIIGAFGTVMLPKMSNLIARGNIKESSRYMTLSMKYIMCLTIALSCGIAGMGTVFAPIF